MICPRCKLSGDEATASIIVATPRVTTWLGNPSAATVYQLDCGDRSPYVFIDQPDS